MAEQYYNGNKLLTLRDLKGNKPEMFICIGNRSAGKTYYFKRLMLRRFVKKGQKFILLTRYKNDAIGKADAFMEDMLNEKDFEGCTMVQKGGSSAPYTDLYYRKSYIDDEGEIQYEDTHCGYIIPLSLSDKIKPISSKFTDADVIFYDEFMPETGKNLKNEIHHLLSIHTSVARGGANGRRYLPVIMCSNSVTIMNDYLLQLGITERLTGDVKYMRGNGWVFEMCYNPAAANKIKNSGISRAFYDTEIMKYSTENKWLNDSDAFITKEKDSYSEPLFNIYYRDKHYGVYKTRAYIYISKIGIPEKLTVAAELSDHMESTMIMPDLKNWCINNFNNGTIRFDSQQSKMAFLQLAKLSY